MKPVVVLACAVALIVAAGPAFAVGPVHKACEADMARLCPDAPREHGKTRDCMEAQKDKLSPACKAALESTPRGSNKLKQKEKEKSQAPDE